jgi:uncharacterized membrane protein
MHYKEITIKRKYEVALLICIVTYSLVFSYYTNLKHYTFSSYAWDLGIFNQLFHSTIFGGKFLYYTAELYLNPLGNYFAIHFSPILMLLFPFYAVFPRVQTLLFSKCLILGLAALPLYYLTKELTGSDRTSFLVGVSYLLHPGLHGANWFDFQPQVFIPFMIFATYLTMIKEMWTHYLFFFLLSLFIQEHVTLIMTALHLSYLASFNHREILDTLKTRRFNKFSISIASIFISIFCYLLFKNYIQSFPIEPEFISIYKATGVFSALEFKGKTLFLPIFSLLHPINTLNALTFDIYLKFFYLLFLLAPLIFLPLMNRTIFLHSFIIIPFILSNYRAYYMIGSHYSLYIIPSLFISTIYTLKAIDRSMRERLSRYILAVSALMIIVLSPITPFSGYLNEGGKILWYPETPRITQRILTVHGIIDIVPEEASILTQNHIFPHFSNRVNAYVLPISTFSPDQTEILESYVEGLVRRCEYALLDLKSVDHWTLHAHKTITSDPSYRIEAFSDMAVLFRRGDAGSKTHPEQLQNQVYLAYKDMHLGLGAVVSDQTTESGLVATCPKGSGNGHFLYGPYTYLIESAYDVGFVVKVDDPDEGYIGTLEVSCDRGAELISKRDLYGYEFPDGGWRRITLHLSLSRPRQMVEFRLYTVGRADISVDRIQLNGTGGEWGGGSSTWTFDYRDLMLQNGTITAEGFLLHSPDDGDDVFWHGPYYSLPGGDYRITYFLKVNPNEVLGDEAVILLDACHTEGRHVIARKEVTVDDLNQGGLGKGWTTVEMNVTAKIRGSIVEFRGRRPSSGHEVYLGHILLEPEKR